MRARTLAILGLVASSVGHADVSDAYCLSVACEDRDDGKSCNPIEPDDCDGGLLRWKSGCVGFGMQESGSDQVSTSKAAKAAVAAFSTWSNADCGGGTPDIHVEYMGKVECAELEYNKAAGNANIVVFRDGEWPYPEDQHSVAKTTTTFDPDSGALVDADIEINTASFALSTSVGPDQFDLQSVLTHEAGHFLGLGHSATPEAAMYSVYQAGTDLRVLTPDDVAAICTLYPPSSKKDADCNPIPKHGFDTACKDDQVHADCSAGAPPIAPRSGRDGLVVGMGLALLALRARRGSPTPSRCRTSTDPRRGPRRTRSSGTN